MRNLVIGSALILAVVTATPAHAGTEPYLAEITLFSGNFPPRGWMFCEGQTLPIASNTGLFSLIGTTYGGDGRTTFKLPDLRKAEERLREGTGLGKDAKHLRYIIAIQGVYPPRP